MAAESGIAGRVEGRTDSRAVTARRLYLPTVVVAGLAAWLGWRGWTALAGTELEFIVFEGSWTGTVRCTPSGRANSSWPGRP